MQELVSIITPSYNAAKYIADTIQSVQAQTYTNWEMIIADDCSTDNTDEVVQNFLTDTRIRYIKNEKNSGAAETRNNAISKAQGRWIAFVDSDDIWAADKLEKHIAFMKEKEAALSFTHYTVVDEEGKEVALYAPKKEEYTYKMILKHCSIGCSTAIYDREKLGTVYMPTNAEKREDFACWLQILRTGVNAFCLHESLTRYRVHRQSVSSSKGKMIKYQWRVYRRVEKLGFFKSLYYMCHWAIKGFFKYK